MSDTRLHKSLINMKFSCILWVSEVYLIFRVGVRHRGLSILYVGLIVRYERC